MKTEEQKERILKFLKGKGWLPSTTIAETTGLNYYKVVLLTGELWRDGKIEKDAKPSQTFWKLN